MKLRFFILSIACMAIFAMPAQAASKARTKVQTTKSAEAVKVSTQEFNKLKATLTSAISEMKSAASAKAVTNSMYNYTKSCLGIKNVYKSVTNKKKKQLDVLVKQIGVQKKTKKPKKSS
ncbi:MAG: hypothetical protein SO194_08945, partial [Sodaliphilus sp.]|nr:hypothetical protein [Sodaliphilus sp.]